MRAFPCVGVSASQARTVVAGLTTSHQQVRTYTGSEGEPGGRARRKGSQPRHGPRIWVSGLAGGSLHN